MPALDCLGQERGQHELRHRDLEVALGDARQVDLPILRVPLHDADVEIGVTSNGILVRSRVGVLRIVDGRRVAVELPVVAEVEALLVEVSASDRVLLLVLVVSVSDCA